jgi:hypothetical protein
VKQVVFEAYTAFAPLARREWLSWGGDILFFKLKEEVEEEERKAEEDRARSAEEEARRLAEDAKRAEFAVRRAALEETRDLLFADFRAKRVTKEELRKRTAELAVEETMIAREEAGEEDEEEKREEEDEEEAPVIRLGKRKTVPFADEEDDDVDQLGDEQVEPKRARFASNGRRDCEGPVSFVYCSRSSY